MHRTTPIITNTPSVSQTYKTAILSEFKGIDETVNPFSAVKNSAKECTNLYVDDEGTLVTRPRVEFVQTLPTNERYYKTFKLYDETQKWFWVSVYLKPFEVYVKDSVASNFIKYAITSTDIEEPTFFHNDQNKFVIGSKADGTSALYVATFDFNLHTINLKEPTYYLPTSQLYDIESDSYYALNEQGNLWTSASAATMYWSLKTISNPVYRKRDLKILKNEYYDYFQKGGLVRYDKDNFLLYDYISKWTLNTSTNKYDCSIFFADKSTKTVSVSFEPKKIAYDVENDFFIILGSTRCYINGNETMDISEDLYAPKIDTRNSVIVGYNDLYTKIYIYSYSDIGSVIKKAEFTVGAPSGSQAFITIDQLHKRVYLMKNMTTKFLGNGHIDFSDINNIKYEASDDFDADPVSSVIYYDVDKNLAFVETDKGFMYSIDSNNVATKKDYWSNIGTNDEISINRQGHQLIHLRPEGKIVDNGRITSSTTEIVEGSVRVSVNDNIISYYEAYQDAKIYQIFKYKSDTAQPLLYIDMPIEADPPKNINRVSRFNNNFVFWSTKSNTVYFTRYNDPTYIPASYYEAYGGANGVKGVLRISDEYLAVLKEDQAYITWTKDNLFYSNELRVHTGCSQEEACIVCNYSNLPIMVNNDGVWSLGQSSSVTYQDTVFGSISDRIDKGFTEYLPNKYILHNHKYYTYIGYNRDDSGIIWMYDNRINMWFKWVLPITITDFIEIDDVTYIVSTYSNKYNELYRLDPYGKQVDDDVQYLDEVHKTTPNYKNINWKWVSQPLPLNTLNFKKRIKYLKLIFANKYESDHITFKYWFRTYTQTEYPTNPKTYTAEITTLKTQKLKPRIPRFDFLQIILESNNDSDQFEDGVGNTVSTTLNDKIGFVSIALNYLLLEG